jgi:hypothetical protein
MAEHARPRPVGELAMSAHYLLAALWLSTIPTGLVAMAVSSTYRAKVVEQAYTARRMYVETPLRLVTGRRRPDYQRIAELERTELP